MANQMTSCERKEQLRNVIYSSYLMPKSTKQERESAVWRLQQSALTSPHLSYQSEMKHFTQSYYGKKNFSPADDNTRTAITEKKKAML